ncbi:YdbL family protein [Caulobacter sp.]|uniref:YdbL family protein n=1 Tax=Caulobacter sp. TaxID=78 RepID=UPI0025C56D98|nr:YdbL family protein [Caulobacter sp.]
MLLAAMGTPERPALAQSSSSKALVDAAKADGKVGEQADGYLGFVTAQDDPELTAAVAEINTARARLYEETARRHGVTPEVAGVAAAKALFETKLRPGDYYRDATGVWRRK